MERGRSYILIALVLLAAAGAAGAQWHAVKTGLWFHVITFGNPDTGYAAITLVDYWGPYTCYHDNYFRSVDGGRNWESIMSIGGGPTQDAVYEMKQRNSIIYILRCFSSCDGMISGSYIDCSWDNGNNWTDLSFVHNGVWFYRNGIDIDERGNLWRADNVAWKRIDSMSEWDSIGIIIPESIDERPSSIWISDTLNAHYLIKEDWTDSSTLFSTNDGCITWSLISKIESLSTLAAPVFKNLWGIAGTKIIASCDSGRTWQVQYTNDSTLLCITSIDTMSIWVGSSQGKIFKTINGGDNWSVEQLSTTGRVISLCFISDTCGWAVTSDSTLWGYGIAGTGVSGGSATTSISVNPDIRIYPNPGAGKRNIEFTLEKQGQVNVSIYDISGRCIKGIAGGACQAGRHSIQWDGLDGKGSIVPSGVYICRVNGPGIELKAKALVINGR